MGRRRAAKRPQPPQKLHAEWAAELEALYAEIPPMQCRGQCQAACGPIDFSDAEAARLAAHPIGAKIPRAAHVAFTPGSCPALTILGQCAVYALRPMVCRLWGAVMSMHCKHGCQPVGGWLPEIDGQILLLRSLRVGAPPAFCTAVDRQIAALRDKPEISAAWSNYTALWGSNAPRSLQNAALHDALRAGRQ